MENNPPDNIESFIDYLDSKKLSDSTKACYVRDYIKFKTVIDHCGLNQRVVDAFLIERMNHRRIRAFVKNYLEFIDDRTIRIKKITGRSSKRMRTIIPPNKVIKIIQRLYELRPDLAILIHLIYDCGLRRSEALNIKLNDFEWDAWNQDRSRRCILKITGKGDKDRFVMVSPDVMSIIVIYVKENKDKINLKKPMIKTSRTALSNAFKKTGLELYNEDYRLHDLRKARATEWHEEGKTLEQIKIRLGHESVTTTELYVRPMELQELQIWNKE